MFRVEHASSTGYSCDRGGEGGGGGGGGQASCLVAKQAVEFPQVLASYQIMLLLRQQIQTYFHQPSCGIPRQNKAIQVMMNIWSHKGF